MKSAVLIGLACALAYTPALRAQTPPPLPQISFADFSPDIRAQIQKAYAEAKAKPRNAAANGQLGMALHAYEQYDFAASCYARAAHFAPQEFRWLYYFGQTQAALGNHRAAVTAFKTALRLQPAALPAQLRLAEAQLAAGQFRASQTSYEALLKQTEIAAQAQYGLGQVKLALGDRNAALAHFQQALAHFPQYGVAHYALGLALRDQGRREEAQKHLAWSQQYKLHWPLLADPLLQAVADLNASASNQLQRGVMLAGIDKLEPAIAAHERALALNPQLVQAHINLISLYARAGQMDKAEQHYQAATAKNPQLADSHFNYGVVLLALGRAAEAEAAFQRSLERNPFSADAHFNYASIIERDGRLAEAATHFQQALDNNPEHRLAHFHLARLLVMQEKLPEAIAHLLRTLTVEDEDTPRFTYALGATYIRAGEREKGLQYLRAGLKKAQALKQAHVSEAIERDLRRLGQEP
jgi:tetratricopeptide (TPR) repeat protein